MIFLGIEVVSNAERSTDFILSSVSLTNVASVIELTVVVLRQLCVNLLCALIQLLIMKNRARLLRQRIPKVVRSFL